MQYTKKVLTNQGLALIASADAGLSTIRFTKVVLSSQDLSAVSEDDLKAYTELTNIELEKSPPDALTVGTENDGPVIYIRALFSNQGITSPVTVNTIGLYATDETNEILIAISANEDSNPIVLPIPSTGANTAFDPKLAIPISRLSSIDWTVNPAGSISQEDLENLRNLIINTNYPNKVYINNRNNGEVQNGSAIFPYKTISAALLAHSINPNLTEFIIAPGTYSDNITLTGIENIYLHGEGAIGAQQVRITGGVLLSETCKNIGISDIFFTDNFSSNSEDGGIYLDNCRFNSFTCGTAATGNIVADFCEFENNVNIYGNPSVLFRGCDFGTTGVLFMRNTGETVECNECRRVALNHLAGRYISTGNTQYKKYAGGAGISSTAAGLGNELVLFSGTTAQEDGTFARISILDSSCYYIIGNFIHDFDGNDNLNGNRVLVGPQVADIIDDNEYGGFTNTTKLLKDTLKLFDTAFLTNQDILEAVKEDTSLILSVVNNINSNLSNLIGVIGNGFIRNIVRVSLSTSNVGNSTIAVNFVDPSKVAVIFESARWTGTALTSPGGINEAASTQINQILNITNDTLTYGSASTGQGQQTTRYCLVEFI